MLLIIQKCTLDFIMDFYICLNMNMLGIQQFTPNNIRRILWRYELRVLSKQRKLCFPVSSPRTSEDYFLTPSFVLR